jgi:hypothetical protein
MPGLPPLEKAKRLSVSYQERWWRIFNRFGPAIMLFALDSLAFPQNAEEHFLLASRWAPLQANLTAAACAERGADADVVVN